MAAVRRTLAVVALLLGLSALRAGADESDDRMAAVRADGVRRLETLASWCRESKIEGARHRTMRAILSIDPGHAGARLLLGYYREKKGGAWLLRDEYREPPDLNKDVLAEYDHRFEEAVWAYRNDVLSVLDRAGGESGARFTSVLDGLVSLVPRDEFVHRARGDVKAGGRWLMPETVRAVTRRKELRAVAQKALRDVAPPARDPEWKTGWRASVRTTHLRVVGTVDLEEAERVARLSEAAKSFVEAVFPGKQPLRPPPKVVLLQSKEAGKAFVLAHPGMGEAKWREIEAAHLSAAWMPEPGGYVDWFSVSADRVSSAVYAVIRALLAQCFGESRLRGWLTEGLARLLCRYLAGSFGPGVREVSETDLGEGKRQSALHDAKDWVAPARRALREADAHRLPALLTMVVNAMAESDVLMALAMAGYVVEGVPEKAAAFISATVTSDDAAVAVRNGLGIDIGTLRERLVRWLGEMEDQ